MSEKDLNQDEEDKSKPHEGSESEDELADLFKEEEAPEGETLEEKVARMEAEHVALKKGVAKAFSQRGREVKKVEEEPVKAAPTQQSNQSDDVAELFFTVNPKAKFVDEQLKEVADKFYGGSRLKAWNGEKFLREKAESLANEETERETNKQKLNKPAIGKSGGVTDYKSMPQKEALKLSDEEFAKWSEANQ